jgi:hypothetical protein
MKLVSAITLSSRSGAFLPAAALNTGAGGRIFWELGSSGKGGNCAPECVWAESCENRNPHGRKLCTAVCWARVGDEVSNKQLPRPEKMGV